MKDDRGVGGGGAVHLRPIQRAGVLSAFGRFNERGCRGGAVRFQPSSLVEIRAFFNWRHLDR